VFEGNSGDAFHSSADIDAAGTLQLKWLIAATKRLP